jgi:hypothetical protein
MKPSGFFNRYLLVFILIIEVLTVFNVKMGKDRWKEVIAFDGKGYYAYLPAIFIYHDLHFAFHDSIEKKYSPPRAYYEFRVPTESGIVDKYFSGTAIGILPFFLMSHLTAIITGDVTDGYSYYYMLGICFAAIFYCLTGLYFLRKILKIYSIPDNISVFVIITFTFGTQLFYYTVFEPSISHIYSFAFISAFIYFLKRFVDERKKNQLILSGFLLGLITLTRPVNGLIIFILPLLCTSKNELINIIRHVIKTKSGIIQAAIVFLLVVSIQGIIYFLQTGRFFVDSYVVEGFIWNRPEMINILFSYKKGLIIYTPLILFSLFGLIPLYRKNKFQCIAFSSFFLLIIYIFSCWIMWWYGGSFSSRPFVEYFSIFALIMAFALTAIKRKTTKIIFYAILIFCIILCQVQTYQYRYLIIHWDKMDKEHYWRVFMRVDQLVKEENANKDLLY